MADLPGVLAREGAVVSSTARRRPVPVAVILMALGGVVVWFAGASRRRGGRGRHPAPVPPRGIEFGEARFPPAKVGKRWEQLGALAQVAEDVSGMAGLRSYLLATARGESNAVPSAMNTKTDAEPAFRLFCRDMNYGRRYRKNPWRPARCERDDPLAARWAYSGGWFQMMPVVALATSDKRANRHDPARVFDPPFAVAYAVDLVARLVRGSGAQSWGDVRAGWALPSWAKPDSEAEGKAVVLERFERRLGQVASMGADPSLATKPVRIGHYPGFTKVLHALLAADGRTAAT